jgi:hypothetical protein
MWLISVQLLASWSVYAEASLILVQPGMLQLESGFSMKQIDADVDPYIDSDSTPPPVPNMTSRVSGYLAMCMAEYVLWTLLEPISCDICRQSVTSQEPIIKYLHHFQLLKIKNSGGLVRPDGLIFIVFAADNFVRTNTRSEYLHCVPCVWYYRYQ